MKTTVEISDALLHEVRTLADREGQTLREAVDAGLRQWVDSRRRRKRFVLRDASVAGKGLQSGLEYDQWGRILQLAYGERA
jgi:hypothetical protein